ncbi:hypothetical protein ACOI9X_04465 [Pseudomonas sp. P2757]|uniref:hypothetical protein n=1 Tax=unclassified Pseudomonas TaxID=196821 RepID=UPI003B5C83A2
MSTGSSSFVFGSLYEITTASGVVSGVVNAAGPDAISVGPDLIVVRYEDILSFQKVEIRAKIHKEMIGALKPSSMK